MAAFPAKTCCLTILLLIGHILAQSPTVNTTAESPTTVQTTTEIQVQRNCSTARALQGVCVARNSCEFSSFAIDFTLYMPRWYKNPCEPGQTCCPSEYISVPEPYTGPQSSDFDYDDP